MEIKIKDANNEQSSFISWYRLEQALKSVGELAKHEELVRVEINNAGIEYTVARNENNN